ncbi:SemiSWEET transporter [Undibacterium cyanobacteriorum]|uniref:SemiSWEET transporter n=1 Tax=Undibacterium cyanobacteriorum TaxID=3073561 RepID=A0ABY9RLV2_9BURK|nr:SemiSWEET transporter [Undibacterium sp. 20NA77.5]WMW81669.1 SemiSWEET transporter [Undibacterium sp. 20NA77.5]
MSFIDSIGFIAAFLTTSAFIPQAWMTWKRKRAEGVSLGMYCIMVSGVICWLIYGLMLGAMPIIIANLISLALSAFILAMKLIYK